MNVCEQLKPQKVFAYFEDICQIPHGSGNTKKISDYCVSFAQSHDLKFIQDQDNNVIIFKDASPGYENSEPVIIQGHLDMVCEKEAGVEIDFEKDGLNIFVEEDMVKAKGTTLGGDDGIAIAYALALLDDDSLEHPPLEAVFTVDEEIGMFGAESIDLSMLKGRTLLNIDSEEEGIFLTSCAGGLRAECRLPVSRVEADGICFEIKVHELLGGHSGVEINKGRGNAVWLLGRVLDSLSKELPFAIVQMNGGLKDNAIPREASATILLESQDQKEALKARVKELDQTLKKEYQSCDPDVSVGCKELETGKQSVLHGSSASRILFFLRMMPNGVQAMSMDIDGLVETSLNAGIMVLSGDVCSIIFSVRSSVTSKKRELTGRLSFLTEFLGGEISVSGDYPAWEYQADSRLRELMAQTYRDLFQKEPQIQAIHAGLECGLLSNKIPGLDCISFGPDIFDIHTPNERLSISSVERVWLLLLEVLKRLK